MEQFAAEDPSYDIEAEKKLLWERYGYEDLSPENEDIFWFVHDILVFGYSYAKDFNLLEIPEYKLFSYSLRMRRVAKHFNYLKAGLI